MFWVYILKNPDCIYYKGFTENLPKRFKQHNNDEGRFTAEKGPWVLVYVKSFETKRAALIEEKRVKRLNKESLERLISGNSNEITTIALAS